MLNHRFCFFLVGYKTTNIASELYQQSLFRFWVQCQMQQFWSKAALASFFSDFRAHHLLIFSWNQWFSFVKSNVIGDNPIRKAVELFVKVASSLKNFLWYLVFCLFCFSIFMTWWVSWRDDLRTISQSLCEIENCKMFFFSMSEKWFLIPWLRK